MTGAPACKRSDLQGAQPDRWPVVRSLLEQALTELERSNDCYASGRDAYAAMGWLRGCITRAMADADTRRSEGAR